jgi:hypothetical protein
MDPKYFRVMALDGAVNFIPTGSFNGKFYGVTKVEAEEEYNRLKARGCAEISAEEYDAEAKKKALSPTSLDDFRPLVEVVKIARPAESKPTEKPAAIAVESVRTAVPVPKAASAVKA